MLILHAENRCLKYVLKLSESFVKKSFTCRNTTIKNLKLIVSFMNKDKKNTSSKINLILLSKIGKPILDLNFSPKKITSFIKNELIN